MNFKIQYIFFLVLFLACSQVEKKPAINAENTEIKSLNHTQDYEKIWDDFRFGLIENSRDFDWAKYGIETADKFYDIAEDLDSEYAKSILAETTFEMLDKGVFNEKETKVLSIVAASADIIIGYNYHFMFSENGLLELIGRTPYEE